MKKIAKTSFVGSVSAIIAVMLGYLCNIKAVGIILILLTTCMFASIVGIYLEEEPAQRKRKRFLRRRQRRVINYR